MQLNKTHKAAVVQGLARATYQERFDNLVSWAEAFAARVFEHEFGDLDRTLREKLSQAELRLAFTVGVEFTVRLDHEPPEDGRRTPSDALNFPSVFGRGVCKEGKLYDNVLLVGSRSNSTIFNRAERFKADDYLATRQAKFGSDIHLAHDHPMAAELRDLLTATENLEAEAAQFISDLNDSIAGFKTDTRLVELIPEAEPYIQRPNKSQNVVPMSTIEAVRKRIAAPGGAA